MTVGWLSEHGGIPEDLIIEIFSLFTADGSDLQVGDNSSILVASGFLSRGARPRAVLVPPITKRWSPQKERSILGTLLGNKYALLLSIFLPRSFGFSKNIKPAPHLTHIEFANAIFPSWRFLL